MEIAITVAVIAACLTRIFARINALEDRVCELESTNYVERMP